MMSIDSLDFLICQIQKNCFATISDENYSD